MESDGTFILFDTNQRTEDGYLARIDLQLSTPRFREINSAIYSDRKIRKAPDSANIADTRRKSGSGCNPESKPDSDDGSFALAGVKRKKRNRNLLKTSAAVEYRADRNQHFRTAISRTKKVLLLASRGDI